MTARAPGDGPDPAEQVHQQARAKGHAQIHQVHGGTQNVVHHHHYPGDSAPAPLALPDLRVWIERLASDYRALISAGDLPPQRRRRTDGLVQLDALRHELDGATGPRHGKNQMRRLLAAGAAQYLHQAARPPTDPLPESVMVDLAVFALWPVVQTPQLPDGWQDHLAELTAPRLAMLVTQAREAGRRGHPVPADVFSRALADRPFAHGILALLEDLGDPRGGGACLTPIALAGGFPPPPRKAGAKAVLVWLLGVGAGAGGGVGGVEAPEAAERAWRWLQDSVRGSGTTPASGSGDFNDQDVDQHRGGGGRASHPGGHGAGPVAGNGSGHGFGGFIDDLFH
ncbi:hypothetical protein C8250_008960 [Streptomyces sp. So13.3]|uniref:hypothetical protein n=1 Tax=Streptomyces sp. So13.3 TaxID=2136173 RepID=UPI001106C8B5|nr:hypothetical protein [Streptomyces sp. So13.3]QNA72014.1 hypothetical protein C8250_008960 [Streptomyces sp. So13.3]